MNREEINNKLEFMQELANRFPTKDDAVTEIKMCIRDRYNNHRYRLLLY